MKHLQNRVAAITGAGSGIGRHLALNLAAAGCHLAISDINETGLAETVGMLGKYPVRVTYQTLDVSDREAMYAWADRVAADHGRVNLLFNNAGVALGSTVEGMSYADLEWIVGINFWGVVYGTKAFLPHLKASGEGHIINTSSVFGLAGIPSQSAYNATKFAVRGFTEALRQELDLTRSCVSASCVHPGGIRTNIARAARFSDNVEELLGQDEATAKARFELLFITSADRAARVILKGVRRNRRRILIGPDARLIDWIVRLMPSFYQRIVVAGTRLQIRAG